MSLLFLLFLLAGCEKEQKIIPDNPVPSLIKWSWNADLTSTQNELYADPILYKDWVIISYISDYLNQGLPILTAFDKRTGGKVWEYRYSGSKTENLRNLKLIKDRVVILFTDRLICFDLLSKQIVWEQLFDQNERISHPMDVYGDYIYKSIDYYDNVSDYPFNDSVSLFRYHIQSGTKEKLFGERKLKNSNKHPKIYPSATYILNNKDFAFFTINYLDPGKLHPVDFISLNINTKLVEWRNQSYSPITSAWNTPPIRYNDKIIVASDWSIYSFNISSGVGNWIAKLDALNKQAGFSFSGPFLHGDRIYAVENDGIVFCLNAETGKLLWQNTGDGVNTNGPARGPCNRPIVVGNILFINTWSDQALVLIDVHDGTVIKKITDAKYNGTNVLYDEETETFFVMADDKLRAFTIHE